MVCRDVFLEKRCCFYVAVEDQMFLGMRDFDFCPNRIYFTQI